MLESDARKKRCPYKMAHSIPEGDRVGDIHCVGLDCMGWDERKRPDPDYRIGTYIPRDPPEGDCGMKSPTEE